MATPPIANIIDDILVAVFAILTDPIPLGPSDDRPRPLDKVRAASQVCRHWRGLLFSSTWIWGRVIDIEDDSGSPGRGQWIEEVLRRAGSAPLWIYGSVLRSSYGSGFFNKESFFLRLLESWDRIEKISVFIGIKISEPMLRHFLRPAPILKRFDVRVADIQAPLFLSNLRPDPSPLHVLFADHAPLLRELTVCSVTFKLDSPWLSNIREISNIPSRAAAQDILTLLHHTPLLNTLYLVSQAPWNPTQPLFPRRSFRNLSVIELHVPLSVTASILDHISPGKLSIFRINTCHKQSPNNYIVSCLKKHLPGYIRNYFTVNPARTIEFSFPTFRFADDGEKTQRSRPHHAFQIDVWPDSHFSINDDLILRLLDIFSESFHEEGRPFLLNTVIKIKLAFWPRPLQPTLLAKLYPMLSTFTSVRKLEINERDVQIFWSLASLENQQLLLFPELDTILLTSSSFENDKRLIDGYILQFLFKRKEIGRPVARLDLTIYGSLQDRVRDFSVFDQVDGLEVAFMRKSKFKSEGYIFRRYICGTGMPEILKLDLRERRRGPRGV